MPTRIPKRRLMQETLLIAGCTLLSLSAAKADYPATVINDSPLAYYRLNDTPTPSIATNRGTLGATGNGIYSSGVLHRQVGALAGDSNASAGYDNNGAHHTQVPYRAALNPSSSSPFTIEAWLNPTVEVTDAPGPCPLFNRVSSGNRSGWVFFQRSPTTGWNFRMYNGSGSSVGIDLSGGTNAAGTWSHVVAVWSGSQASLYCNGVLVAGPISPTGGYNASSSAIFSIGSYDDGSNPFFGNADEVAFYPTALSGAQILAHYQNGTNTAPATPYSSLVASHGALEYLRLDEADPAIDTAINSGRIGVAGDGMHFPGMKHQVAGAIVGSANGAAGYDAIDKSSTDGGYPTVLPFIPELNTAVFTVEAWLKPTAEGNGNAQCPLYNRREDSPRTGWVFFQRDHTTGWNLRMYNGVDTSRSIDITGGPYTIGQWVHLVATYDGSVGKLYQNGVLVGSQNVVGAYVPNADTIKLGVGGYSDGSQNPFIGSIDEFAIYTNALTASQILAHYQNGTNAARSAPYDQIVLNNNPVEYLRLGEAAVGVAANAGTLGTTAGAVYVNSTNGPAGLQSPTFAGFEADNASGDFNGINGYVELLNPTNLNFSGQVTLEAWVQPAGAQNGEAYIIAHGGNDDYSAENALRIENGIYQILSYNGVSHGASYPVPPEDLGTGNWVHLVGTYDGANWNLYRNGLQVATAADSIGILPVDNANWAIGARGRWKYASGFPATGEDRQFTGEIDEAAIYNHALTPQQVQAHYSAGAYGAHPLIVTRSGGQTILTWSTGTLQEATAVTGPYTDVTGAASPYTAPAGPARKFYRLRF